MTDPLIALLEELGTPPADWDPSLSDLSAPFPWFGGKSRAAALIWERLGDVDNYVDPFAGSLAIPLRRPHAPRVETFNDLDGHLVNFWRSIAAHPHEVAAAADWPVMELDLHARHVFLTRIKGKLSRVLEDDLFYCAPKIAGWWVWGLCAWWGSGWCSEPGNRKRPAVGGRGVHRKGLRVSLAGGGEGYPGQGPHPYHGKGVHGATFKRQLPDVGSRGGDGIEGGRGVHSALYELFGLLSRRLRHVRVTCGDWRRIMTPSVTWKHGTTGVVLDPPYEGYEHLYAAGSVSADVRKWCIEEATRGTGAKLLRVALCGYEGEHNELEALRWTKVSWKAHGGLGNQGSGENVNAHRERIWFSPACIKPVQLDLFGGAE